MAKNNKTAAGGPKTSPSPTPKTLFNTLQTLLTRLEKIEAISNNISPTMEAPQSLIELLFLQLDGLAKELEQLERTLDSNSVHTLEIQTKTQIPPRKQGTESYVSATTLSLKQTSDQVPSITRLNATMSHPLPTIPPNSYITALREATQSFELGQELLNLF
jgi:hypothetical protein